MAKEIAKDKWKHKFHRYWLPEKIFVVEALKSSENKEDNDLYLEELAGIKRYADSSYEYEEFSKLFKKLEEEAKSLNEQLEKCGRFRNRNEVLGRETS